MNHGIIDFMDDFKAGLNVLSESGTYSGFSNATMGDVWEQVVAVGKGWAENPE